MSATALHRRTGTRARLVGRLLTALLLPALLVLVAPGKEARAESVTLGGPGLGEHDDADVSAPPRTEPNYAALAERLLEVAQHAEERPVVTVADWVALAEEALPWRVVYLGRAAASDIALAGPTSPSEPQEPAAWAREWARQSAAAHGLELRAFEETLVIAEANLGYVVGDERDWPLVAALVNGRLEPLEQTLLAHPEHRFADILQARLETLVAQRLRAAPDANTFASEFALWRTYADAEILHRMEWMEFRQHFLAADVKDIWDAAQEEDSPLVPLAAVLASRLLGEDDPLWEIASEHDPHLRDDLQWWHEHREDLAALTHESVLPAAYWRHAGCADEQGGKRFAEQVHRFGNDPELMRHVRELPAAHLAALLAFPAWRDDHAPALAWLAERMRERSSAKWSQLERDALATALAQPIRNGGAHGEAALELATALQLVEAVPAVRAMAEAHASASAVRAVAQLAPELADEEEGLAARLLSEHDAAVHEPELLRALCALAAASLDRSATDALAELAQRGDADGEVRTAAVEALYVVAPGRAHQLVQAWRTEVPGEWAQPLLARLAPPAVREPLAQAREELAEADGGSAIAVSGAQHLDPLVATELFEALAAHGLTPVVGEEARDSNDVIRHLVCEPSKDEEHDGAAARMSNLAAPWREPVTVRAVVGEATHAVELRPVQGVLLARATRPEPQAMEPWRRKLSTFAAETAALPLPEPEPESEHQPDAAEETTVQHVPGTPATDPGGDAAALEEPLRPDSVATTPEPERDAASLHLDASIGSTRFSESAPAFATLDSSFAEGLRMGLDLRVELDDILPGAFGLLAQGGLDVFLFSSEVWRAQENDLSRLDLVGGLGIFVDALAATEPTDWGLRALLTPSLLLADLERTNVAVGDTPGEDQSLTMFFVGARLAATFWNERPFSDGLPLGLLAAGELGGWVGEDGGFHFRWYGGLTWSPSRTITLLLAFEHRYEEFSLSFNDIDQREQVTESLGGRLALTISW